MLNKTWNEKKREKKVSHHNCRGSNLEKSQKPKYSGKSCIQQRIFFPNNPIPKPFRFNYII